MIPASSRQLSDCIGLFLEDSSCRGMSGRRHLFGKRVCPYPALPCAPPSPPLSALPGTLPTSWDPKPARSHARRAVRLSPGALVTSAASTELPSTRPPREPLPQPSAKPRAAPPAGQMGTGGKAKWLVRHRVSFLVVDHQCHAAGITAGGAPKSGLRHPTTPGHRAAPAVTKRSWEGLAGWARY